MKSRNELILSNICPCLVPMEEALAAKWAEPEVRAYREMRRPRAGPDTVSGLRCSIIRLPSYTLTWKWKISVDYDLIHPPLKSFSCVLFSIQGKTCLRMHQTEKTKFYNLLRHSSQQKTGIQQSVVWQVLQVFGFYFFILTIKVTERRPNKMRMRFIIFRFLSTIFWFILSSLTPAALSCGLLPSNSVSSSSLVTFQYNRLNLQIFLFYRDSVLPRMEWFWSPSLGSNNGSMIVTFGRPSPSSMFT